MKDERRSSRPGDVAPQASDDDDQISNPPESRSPQVGGAARLVAQVAEVEAGSAQEQHAAAAVGAFARQDAEASPLAPVVWCRPLRAGRGRRRPRRRRPASGHRLDIDSEEFFAQGDRGDHPEGAASQHPAVVARPEVHDLDSIPPPRTAPPERMKEMRRWVTIAVIVCAGLLLIAIGRLTVSSTHPAPAAAAAAVAPEAPPAAAPPTVAAAPAPIPPPPSASPIPPGPDPAASASAPVASASAAPAEPGKSAEEERKDAQHALEHGKPKDAVEAALRSVQLDPTDASAWLILGASYLGAGTKGPTPAPLSPPATKGSHERGRSCECRSMLR